MMLLFHIPRRVQSTYILECRGSIIGIATMIWGSIPHNTVDDICPALPVIRNIPLFP